MKKANEPPQSGDEIKMQPVNEQNSLAILNGCFDGLTFRDTEELHNTLLAAAQIEHTKVREKALHLLELDEIRRENEHLQNQANAAKDRAERVGITSQNSKPATKLEFTVPVNTIASSIIVSRPESVIQQMSSPNEPITNFLGPRMAEKVRPAIVSTIAQTNTPIRTNLQNQSPSTKISNSAILNQVIPPTTKPKASLFSSKKLTEPQADTVPAKFSFLTNSATPSQPVTPGSFAVDNAQSNKSLSTQVLQSHTATATVAPNRTGSEHQDFKNKSIEFSNVAQYRKIHANMKLVRRRIEGQVNQNNKPTDLRTNCVKRRREITKALGQLVVGGKNSAIVDKVILQLRDSLKDQTEEIEASLFTLMKRQAAPGASTDECGHGSHSGKLPIAFIYLLGAFCKSICAQLVSEAALKPLAASPIGILAARVFSDPHLFWQGKSLIDMLIAKICVACPVLFGIRGDESTQEGRARIGWRKCNGKFISEQAHYDRMSGIASGFAAISLRDFSKTNWKNPFPATNYWSTLSLIVNTPPEEAFSTQYVVLKSLLQNDFSRFISFYGDMAIAALQAALVEFPRRGVERSTSVNTLETLRATLQKDHGLVLH